MSSGLKVPRRHTTRIANSQLELLKAAEIDSKGLALRGTVCTVQYSCERAEVSVHAQCSSERSVGGERTSSEAEVAAAAERLCPLGAIVLLRTRSEKRR